MSQSSPKQYPLTNVTVSNGGTSLTGYFPVDPLPAGRYVLEVTSKGLTVRLPNVVFEAAAGTPTLTGTYSVSVTGLALDPAPIPVNATGVTLRLTRGVDGTWPPGSTAVAKWSGSPGGTAQVTTNDTSDFVFDQIDAAFSREGTVTITVTSPPPLSAQASMSLAVVNPAITSIVSMIKTPAGVQAVPMQTLTKTPPDGPYYVFGQGFLPSTSWSVVSDPDSALDAKQVSVIFETDSTRVALRIPGVSKPGILKLTASNGGASATARFEVQVGSSSERFSQRRAGGALEAALVGILTSGGTKSEVSDQLRQALEGASVSHAAIAAAVKQLERCRDREGDALEDAVHEIVSELHPHADPEYSAHAHAHAHAHGGQPHGGHPHKKSH